ncbi:hypothetical protein J7T55_006628 [Diaporthe amygdali]|uniref:uncharacterized protein n=1 Tax=Phomopsis amygdali TaxID=1214568 RepID=UPI0022FDB21A|nr:uncharacterized protein J7T55_006628 [Diaporthe amygdali]KAJ0125283.1 hypothetical protein J7T55_006628 [Diaporthe amygdali]
MITAATPWYETAIDLWNHNFPRVLKKMHEKHGPIVRVSPWELHIYDPDYFNNVFVTSAKRRTTIEPREGLLMDSFAGDIIGELACGKNPQLMNGQDFTPEWQVPDKLLRIDLFPGVDELIPIKLLKALSPKTASFSIMAVLGVTQIEKIKKEVALQAKDQAEESQSVFHSLLRSDMPPAELSDMRLSADAMALLAAGTATTSSVLTLISFYIISEPRIRNRLRDELGVAMAGVPPGKLLQWTQLEKIPYLNACIKEGVRIGRTFRRNGRISPDQELQYKGYTIPKNTLVSMSLSLQHVDPAVFPEPNRFRPERWLGEYDPRMDDYMQPFSKGSRDCLGKNLARAELYIAIGTLFRPGGPRLTISGCDESDIFPVNDKEWGVPKTDSRGLSVCVG